MDRRSNSGFLSLRQVFAACSITLKALRVLIHHGLTFGTHNDRRPGRDQTDAILDDRLTFSAPNRIA